MAPERGGDELEEGEDAGGARGQGGRGGGGAVEEEVEEAEAERVALGGEAAWEGPGAGVSWVGLGKEG